MTFSFFQNLRNFNFSFPSFAILSFIMFLPSFRPSSCLLVILSMSLIPPSRVWGLMGRWVVWLEHGRSGLPLKQRLTHLCCNPLSFQLHLITLFFYFLSDESSNVRSACCSLTIYWRGHRAQTLTYELFVDSEGVKWGMSWKSHDAWACSQRSLVTVNYDWTEPASCWRCAWLPPQRALEMTREEYGGLPGWKQVNLKKAKGLFWRFGTDLKMQEKSL